MPDLAPMTCERTLNDDARAGRRRHSRLRVCLPARLITLHGTQSVTLLDLSFRGAKVACIGAGLRPGANAVLNWGSFEAFCAVAWVKHDCCGLDFDVPLRPKVLIATRDLADAAPRLDARRVAASEWASGLTNR